MYVREFIRKLTWKLSQHLLITANSDGKVFFSLLSEKKSPFYPKCAVFSSKKSFLGQNILDYICSKFLTAFNCAFVHCCISLISIQVKPA